MIAKELEGKVQQLSQQFHDKVTTIDEKVTTLAKQNNNLQELMNNILQQLSQLQKGKQPITDQRQVDIFTGGTSASQMVLATQPPLEPAERIRSTLMQAHADLLSLAIGHLDADIIPWFHWIEQTMGEMTWLFPFWIIHEDIKAGVQLFKPLTPTPPAPSLLGPISSTLPNNVKRLSSAEQTERRSEGFCFNYDEQFKHVHRCKQSQLLLLDVDITLHNPPKPPDHHSDWKISIIETGWEASNERAEIGRNTLVKALKDDTEKLKEALGGPDEVRSLLEGSTYGCVYGAQGAPYPLFLSLSRLSFDEKEQDRAAVEWARSSQDKRGM
ncbi:hypothetical protein WN943_010920 [Citrus x changshan-huyou]